MAAHKRQFTAEQIAEAKRLYENTGTPNRDIAALLGICNSTLLHRVKEWKWHKRSYAYRSVDLARMVRGAVAAQVTDPETGGVTVYAQPVSEMQRAALAQRIQAIVERQMGMVEQIVGLIGPSDKAEAEGAVRMLAGISRTLRDVAALNQPDKEMPPDGSDDDERDIEEFRAELARRLRGIIEARRALLSGRPDRVADDVEPG